MGGVIFRQNSKEAFRRFREAGVNTDEYMGEYGQKGFFLDVETGKIDAGEFCRRMAEAAGRESVGWDEEGYKKQPVTLGADNGERVQILSGVKAGDKVVTQGAYQVKLAGATNAIPAHSHEH